MSVAGGQNPRSRPGPWLLALVGVSLSLGLFGLDAVAQDDSAPVTSLVPLVHQVDAYHFQLPREEVMVLVSVHPELVTFIPDLAPVWSGSGEAIALRIVDMRRATVLGELGVIRGDLIRAINGAPAREPADLAPLYDALRNGTSVEIALTRLGVEHTLVWETVESASP